MDRFLVKGPPITSPSSSSTVNNLLTFALSGVEGAKYFHEKINENHYPDAKALPHNPSLNAVAALIANNEVSGVHDLVQEVVRVFDTAIDFFKERNPHLAEAAKKCKTAFGLEVKKYEPQQQQQRTPPSSSATPPPKKRAKTSSSPIPFNASDTPGKKEKGMELLGEYIVDCGGTSDYLNGWYVTIEARKTGNTQGSSDMYYFSPKNKKFRSRAEVARHFGLIAVAPKRAGGGGGGGGSKKRRPRNDAERRRIQKEIDKLQNQRNKVEQKLSDIAEEKERGIYPIDDGELKKMAGGARLEFPKPEGSALPGIGHESMSDLLVIFDFLSKFYRSLSLVKTNLDDFATAITCLKKYGEAGAVEAIPPFLSECHVSILRLLIQDEESFDWWRAETRVILSDSIPDEVEPTPAPVAKTEETDKETKETEEDEDEEDSVKTDNTMDELDDDPDFVINEVFDRPRPKTLADRLLLKSIYHPDKSDIVPLNFPLYTGLVCDMLLRHYARRRVMADSEIRRHNGLPGFTKEEVEERSKSAGLRLFPRSCSNPTETNPLESGISHLTSGKKYSTLSAAQKISLLRLLVEAAYDTTRVKDIVESNNTARNDAENKVVQDKKELAKAERALWQQVVARAKEELIKRQKQNAIKQMKEAGTDFGDLTDEQILEKPTAELKSKIEALSAPPRPEITELAKRMKQAELLEENDDVEIVSVARLEEIGKQNHEQLEVQAKELDLENLDSEDSYVYKMGMSRNEIQQLRNVRDNLSQSKENILTMPTERIPILKQLEEAIESESTKELRKAIKEAKRFGLYGKKSDTNATYIQEKLRDAMLAQNEAEKRKKQQEGLAALISEREKSFVRTVPLGEDRDGRRLWNFAGDEPRVWVQEISESQLCDPQSAEKCEETDVWGETKENQEPKLDKGKFLDFCRQEYFADKSATGTPKVTWTWYTGEDNLRQVLKALNEKGRKEKSLKENLRELLEARAKPELDGEVDEDGNATVVWRNDDGDVEHQRSYAAKKPSGLEGQEAGFLESIVSTTSVGVRVRRRVDERHLSKYHNGFVVGWANLAETSVNEDGMELTEEVKKWKIAYDNGKEEDVEGEDVLLARIRFYKFTTSGGGDTEEDSGLWSYYNSMGKFGQTKKGDGDIATTPFLLLKDLKSKEKEFHQWLKALASKHDKAGAWGEEGRALWQTSISDALRDEENVVSLEFVKTRILELEKVANEMSGGEGGEEGGDVSGFDFDKQVLGYTLDDRVNEVFPAAVTVWGNSGARSLFLGLVSECESISTMTMLLICLYHNVKTCCGIKDEDEGVGGEGGGGRGYKSFGISTPIGQTRRTRNSQPKWW